MPGYQNLCLHRGKLTALGWPAPGEMEGTAPQRPPDHVGIRWTDRLMVGGETRDARCANFLNERAAFTGFCPSESSREMKMAKGDPMRMEPFYHPVIFARSVKVMRSRPLADIKGNQTFGIIRGNEMDFPRLRQSGQKRADELFNPTPALNGSFEREGDSHDIPSSLTGLADHRCSPVG